MTTKRFLNVQFGDRKTEIDFLGLERLGPVITSIANYYKDSISSPERVQLWKKTEYENSLMSTWKQFKSLPPAYFEEENLYLTIVLLPSPTPSQQSSGISLEQGNVHLITVQDFEVQAGKRQCIEICDLTTQLKAFADAQLVDDCIQSQNQDFLPYPKDKTKKLYVRKCYKDVFGLLLEEVSRGNESFAISGTPGVGKSLFFVYILYRLVKDLKSKALPLQPTRIVYQMGDSYRFFDLQQQSISLVNKFKAEALILKADTFYIIDGKTAPLQSSCFTLFISSPRSEAYKDFVKQKKVKKWYFPVWTLDDLQTCRRFCYSDLSIETLKESYRIYGGVARYVFDMDISVIVPTKMDEALADVDAVKGVRNIGIPTRIFATNHTLLHIIVSNDGQYQFRYVDIASKYVGEQLWIRHYAQMISNLQVMFGGSPNEISRHLFEIYGHLVFSNGGQTLKCRCLEDDIVSEIKLEALHSQRITFGKDTIPTAVALAGSYYESADEVNFPEVDSLTSQGMFQFTVGVEHPIRGVEILKKPCKLYDEPKLYFVVPPHRFEKFKKQSFTAKEGMKDVTPIAGLKQYVLELPVV